MRFRGFVPVMALSLFALGCEEDSTAPDQTSRPRGAGDNGGQASEVAPAAAALRATQFVLTQADPGQCLGGGGGTAMAQTLTLRSRATLLLYFSATWSKLQEGDLGALAPTLDGNFLDSHQWEFAGPGLPITATVMWPFADVSPGTHTVAFEVAEEGPNGDRDLSVNACAMTVFVIPQ